MQCEQSCPCIKEKENKRKKITSLAEWIVKAEDIFPKI